MHSYHSLLRQLMSSFMIDQIFIFSNELKIFFLKPIFALHTRKTFEMLKTKMNNTHFQEFHLFSHTRNRGAVFRPFVS